MGSIHKKYDKKEKYLLWPRLLMEEKLLKKLVNL